MAYTFEVQKQGRTGKALETTLVVDQGYAQAARQVARRRGYKLATLRVTRSAHATPVAIYFVRNGLVKYHGQAI